MEEFEMSDLGVMTYFLGIEFHKSKLRLLMHQRKYALEILKRCDMEHCNAANTPAEARLQVSKSDDEQNVDPTQYRRMIGSLCYLCNTRPDLAFSVGIASRFMERPKVSHLTTVKRIIRYIKGTLDNVPAINLAKNPIAHGRSKHIEMRFYYLRDLVCEGKLRLGDCRRE
ncbi:uncharacterized mitochondrial protein AtMg00810-like [Vicia villosa]|uniref:uncharacterized mitochondrial protein AtMg00810-like n=1 Tax=Vicia villosa TaxID=3911 RepID=UPI00273C5786|nr:uncharacterized mitochondrial protein AtMg00810-like [Vicia villosa]